MEAVEAVGDPGEAVDVVVDPVVAVVPGACFPKMADTMLPKTLMLASSLDSV